MEYKNIQQQHYVHLSKVGNLVLAGELCAIVLNENLDENYDAFEQLSRAIKTKKTIDSMKKAFYKQFDEATKNELIKLDKKVTRAYDKLMNNTPCLLENRHTIKIGLDREKYIIRPVYDEEYRGIYEFKREKDEFVFDRISVTDFITPHSVVESKISRDYGDTMNKLARLLYIQEEYIKLAIDTALKDKKTKTLVIEMANYLGYLDKETYEELQKVKK